MLKKFQPGKIFKYFGFFYRYLGNSIFIAFGASMMMAILDGAGLTMFLPLLQVAGGSATVGTEEMGEMAFIVEWFEGIGIPLTIVSVLVLMAVFFILKGVAKFCANFYRVILQQRFVNSIRLQNMRLLAGYDYEAFARADSGRIQNTFSGEVERLNSAYRNYFGALQQGIMTFVYIALAYASNPKFAIIVAVGGGLSNLVFSRIYKVTKTASRRISAKMHGFQGFLIQSVTSFKFLKATGLINTYKRRIDRSIVEVEQQQRKVGTMNAISGAIREPLVVGIVVIAIFIQVRVFEEPIGAIILSLLFFYRGLGSLVQMQANYNTFLGASGAIDNMNEFVEELSHDQEDSGSRQFTGLDEAVAVKNLTFSYGNEEPVLREVSINIGKNQTIGVAGESGAGKTTLVNIVCGLLKPDPGMVYIDGVDLRDLDADSYRNKIGYVTQEAQVFNDSIFNNVTFWEERTPDAEARFWRALNLAHADGFVRGLPEGMETRIGINGVNLSGGQRQRISIARELYRNVDILVLDEATSALDSQSEKLIQENIESLTGSYTMIVIAHRLSTIQKADKIIYMRADGGYDIGTFEELSEDSKSFKSMISLQAISTLS